jgi:hypothetical protein
MLIFAFRKITSTIPAAFRRPIFGGGIPNMRHLRIVCSSSISRTLDEEARRRSPFAIGICRSSALLGMATGYVFTGWSLRATLHLSTVSLAVALQH